MDLVWAPLLMLMYISHVRGGGLQVCLTIVNICSDIAIHLTHYITSSLLSLEPPHLWLRKVIVFRNQICLYPALYTKGCSFHCNVFVMELILYMINDPLKQNKLSQVWPIFITYFINENHSYKSTLIEGNIVFIFNSGIFDFV